MRSRLARLATVQRLDGHIEMQGGGEEGLRLSARPGPPHVLITDEGDEWVVGIYAGDEIHSDGVVVRLPARPVHKIDVTLMIEGCTAREAEELVEGDLSQMILDYSDTITSVGSGGVKR